MRRNSFKTFLVDFIPEKIFISEIDGEKSEPFITTKGFRQGDGLSCDLFNICLEMIIRAVNKDTTGTIYNKALQILGYADDLDIITRDIRSLDTAVDNIVSAADDMDCQINISKTNVYSLQRIKVKVS